MRTKFTVPIDRLVELFNLDYESGFLYWKINKCNRINVGARAGSQKKNGYRVICLDKLTIMEHRAVFAIVNGKWPLGDIDHINGVRNDNRPANLRVATPEQNSHNKKMNSRNTSGYKGVSFNKVTQKFSAYIECAGKYTHIGSFENAYDAHIAYVEVARKLHGEYMTNDLTGIPGKVVQRTAKQLAIVQATKDRRIVAATMHRDQGMSAHEVALKLGYGFYYARRMIELGLTELDIATERNPWREVMSEFPDHFNRSSYL